MSKIEKLVKRLNSCPADFTYEEGKKILNYYGFEEDNKGKTSGSRVLFYRKMDHRKIMLHKPHPGNVMKKYATRQLSEYVKELDGSYE